MTARYSKPAERLMSAFVGLFLLALTAAIIYKATRV